MTSERTLLWLAVAAYAVSMLLTMRRLHKGVDVPLSHRVNYLTMLVGFILHTAFLYLRGEQLGRCPLTSPFETTTFVAWAATLVYLVFNTIMNLTTQAQQVACFRNAAAHLEPGGAFVIEVLIPQLQLLPQSSDNL